MDPRPLSHNAPHSSAMLVGERELMERVNVTYTSMCISAMRFMENNTVPPCTTRIGSLARYWCA